MLSLRMDYFCRCRYLYIYFVDVEEDTNLSPWSNYTDCSKNCDYGLHSRSRFCEVPDLTCCGYGPHKEEALCNMGNCDGR